MIGETVRWWVTVTAIGLIALPIVYSLFDRLPGRGYAFAKPAGLLLAGFSYWMVLTLHLLPNRPGSIVWALLPMAIVSAVLARRNGREMREFAAGNAAYIVAVEALFLAALFIAAHLKSYVPEIGGTEKPMDFMMLNAASRSEFYPPEDAWMAGYSVSYYYFGYVIQAMTAKLAAVSTAVAFNLALAGTAALAATASFGLGYEVARLVRRVSFRSAVATGVAAVLLLAVMGNLVGAIEFGIANDIVRPGINDTVQINDLETARVSDACLLETPAGCLATYPSDQTSFWWWWRSTRISADGNSITEFPFFSFLLGDLHPHVMALPYVLTAFGLGLALWSAAGRLGLEFWQRRPAALVGAALLVGGLGFLNTWDLPSFGFLLVALVLARNCLVERDYLRAMKDTVRFTAPLAVLCFVLYSPFYLGFGSQASGLETVVNGATRPLHSALFWGGLVIVNLPLPLVLLGALKARRGDAKLAVAVPAALVLSWGLLTAVQDGVSDLADAVGARGFNWLTFLFFAAGLSAALVALRRLLELEEEPPPEAEGEASVESAAQLHATSLIPVLVAMSTALLLIAGAELFYVKDLFGTRLNTVFKLSYQAWILLAVTGGYSLWWLSDRWQPGREERAALARGAWVATATLVLLASMLYPVSATLSRTTGLDKDGRTLDGMETVKMSKPNDFAAMKWLRDRAGHSERIVEAMGAQYSSAGRMSAFTGVPTVLGWLGHESQWDRDASLLAARSGAVNRVYESRSMEEALQILQQYRVTYVVVGSVEREKYPPEGLDKFVAGLPVAAQFGDTVIYRVPRVAPEAASDAVP